MNCKVSPNQGRLDAVLEDDVVYKHFDKENPNNNLDPLWSIPVPADIIQGGGYGMARYGLRKEELLAAGCLHGGAGGNPGQRGGQLDPEEVRPL